MDKESIFFSCLMVLILFEIGYYLVTPTSIFSIQMGAITSIIIIGIATGIVAGLNVLSSGENTFSTRLIFMSATLLCIFFRLDIPTTIFGSHSVTSSIISSLGGSSIGGASGSTTPIPIGIGLFYPNMTNIFLTGGVDIISIFGMIIISSFFLILTISCLMIVAGDHA